MHSYTVFVLFLKDSMLAVKECLVNGDIVTLHLHLFPYNLHLKQIFKLLYAPINVSFNPHPYQFPMAPQIPTPNQALLQNVALFTDRPLLGLATSKIISTRPCLCSLRPTLTPLLPQSHFPNPPSFSVSSPFSDIGQR
ncbi:unnamed protein product [Citrullus colocynthis]|uniref:Uncharacterized protein n=1 Tax=Citrullus colocynthis TaxID=252529 RepID=A0ABP0YGY0_9ROSI